MLGMLRGKELRGFQEFRGIATDFAMGSGRTPDSVEGMMSAEEVADVVLFAVNQPRNLRMMTVSFRPMNEGSWG